MMKKLLVLLAVLIIIVIILFVTGFDLGRLILRDDVNGLHSGDPVYSDILDEDMTIIVREDKIYLNGELVENASDLKSKIYAMYYKGQIFTVRDDRAVKETYDEVIKVLKEMSIFYIEK